MKETWCLRAVHTDFLTFYTYWCSLDLHIRPNIEILGQNVPTQRFWKIKLGGKKLLLFYLSLSPKERVFLAMFHIFTDRGRLKDHLRSCLSEKPGRWSQPYIFVQQQSKPHKQGANKNKVDPKKRQRKTHSRAKIWYKFLNVFQRCCFTLRLNP